MLVPRLLLKRTQQRDLTDASAPSKLMKELGYGDSYKYAHAYENNFANQEFLPNEIEGTKFYEPGNSSREISQRNFLKNLWKEKYDY